MIKRFDQPGLFAALSEAERYLSARGLTSGPPQKNEPIAISLDYRQLSKWRDLSRTDRDRLDGEIRPAPGGSMRAGPVLVEIYDHCAAALAAFQRPDAPRPMSARAALEATYDGPIPPGALALLTDAGQ